MVRIYNRDCMEAMQEMKTGQYDLSIVDPPYGIGSLSFCTQNLDRPKKAKKTNLWNSSAPNKKYFDELRRVSTHQIIWGANYFSNLTVGRIVWYKHQKHPNMSKCEIAYCSLHSKVEYFDYIWQNVNRKEIIIHPCQKPVALYYWLLQKYAKPGWKILDTHLGSGSIAIACHDLGFNFDGYEIDKQYHDNAMKRFRLHEQQMKLF